MTNIRLVLAGTAIGNLVDALGAGAITVDPVTDAATTDESERRLTLQLTFLHDEPDLRRDIPAIPG